ncbi:MAG: acetyltransferase [Gammaproteobacteria bacterium RBG_16_57_12]|nr:MAG: acetyltransferase [Gammaproteobacteria bacterium RBG_16_57_12]
MYLKHKPSGDLVEVINIDQLIDPCLPAISGRFHAGEELQDTTTFAKRDLCFPSQEALPRCWTDSHYREKK